MPSFSAEAKNEICTLPADGCCTLAELFAETFVCGSISINTDGLQLRYSTENMAVARRIFSTVTRTYGMAAVVETRESQLKKKHTYAVVVQDAQTLLDTLGVADLSGSPPEQLTHRQCCKAALLRGAFLGGGSISNPRKNYHLEFVLNSDSFAHTLTKTLSNFDIKAKTIHRKQNCVVYLNEGDSITSLLALLGAHSSILKMENVRILKEMRNNVNRAVNCETANINKTVNAAVAQLESIKTIEEHIGINKLNTSLREAAYLRRENPEATLQELCELCGTTKSGMNHRLRKINAIASALKKEEAE